MQRVLALFCVLSVVPGVVAAQRRDTTVNAPASISAPDATPACCAIVRVEPAKALVTARETATGFTFRFIVKNRRLLGTLKIGTPVWADFADKTVKLKATDSQPCCVIVATPPPSDSLTVGVPQENP